MALASVIRVLSCLKRRYLVTDLASVPCSRANIARRAGLASTSGSTSKRSNSSKRVSCCSRISRIKGLVAWRWAECNKSHRETVATQPWRVKWAGQRCSGPTLLRHEARALGRAGFGGGFGGLLLAALQAGVFGIGELPLE